MRYVAKWCWRNGAPNVRYGAVRHGTAIMLRVQCDTEGAFRYDEYGATR